MAPLPAETDTTIDMPRSQTGPNPQHLALTLIGDYWGGIEAFLPTAVYLELLAEFGISATSGRAALARLVKRGVLVSRRVGRETHFSASPQVIAHGIQNRSVILTFGARPGSPSGREELWTVVSLTGGDAAARADARRVLAENGLVPLADGTWLGVERSSGAVAERLEQVSGVGATVFVGRIRSQTEGALAETLAGSRLAEVRDEYLRFIDAFEPTRRRLETEEITGSAALVLRTRMMDAWRTVVHHDPGLPEAVLPPDWPLAHARRIAAELYNGLGPAAEEYCRQVVAKHAPDAPPARHVTTTMFGG